MADTNLEPFYIIWMDGLRYLHHEHYHLVDCKDIVYLELNTMESCPFTRDGVIRMEISQQIINVRKEENG